MMSNWETQIQEHSGGKLSCIRYHGSARGKIREKDLAESDVVLTTYGILASEKYVLKRVRTHTYAWLFLKGRNRVLSM